MRVDKFVVNKLHGHINLNISFNEDLTVIVGVNGSGKTSALKLISALLKLDFRTVFGYAFDSATLELGTAEQRMAKIFVESKKSGRTVVLTWKGREHNILDFRSPYFPKSGEVIESLSVSPKDWLYYSHEMARQGILNISMPTAKSNAAEKAARVAALEFLGESRLTFVQLDRTILAVSPDGLELQERKISRPGAEGSSIEPIEEVVSVTKRKYLEYKAATERIRDKAYKDSLTLHFDSITSAIQDPSDSAHEDFTSKLSDMRDRVMGSGLANDVPELKEAALSFFSEFDTLYKATVKKRQGKRIGRRTLDEEQLDAILNLKRRQIERLVKIFEDEAGDSQSEFLRISTYLEVIDRFFKESGKKIVFGKNYELGFEHKTQPNVIRSLKELSSGERQIMIVLTYLAFVSGEGSVFVIDEPELSLHLVWQSLLVGAVKDLRPSGCQIVLATHAPEIAGRARGNCVRLGARSLG